MSQHLSAYYHHQWIGERARNGKHRDLVGGLWDEMSKLQLDLLIQHGMTETSRLLDIGCGSLRLGHAAAALLAPGNYWGTDLSAALIDAGYENEIVPNSLADRLPRSNLVEDAEFTFAGVPRHFDYVMAQSVFTHLPLNHLRPASRPGSRARRPRGFSLIRTAIPTTMTATTSCTRRAGCRGRSKSLATGRIPATRS